MLCLEVSPSEHIISRYLNIYLPVCEVNCVSLNDNLWTSMLDEEQQNTVNIWTRKSKKNYYYLWKRWLFKKNDMTNIKLDGNVMKCIHNVKLLGIALTKDLTL